MSALQNMGTLPLSSIPGFFFFQNPKWQVLGLLLLTDLNDLITAAILYWMKFIYLFMRSQYASLPPPPLFFFP